jgi:hypothetical protein
MVSDDPSESSAILSPATMDLNWKVLPDMPAYTPLPEPRFEAE